MGNSDLTQDKVQLVLKQSQDRRKELEDFIFAIQKRVETEDVYSRSIDATGKLLDRFIIEKKQYLTQISASALTFSAFKADHAHRAEQSRAFAQSLRDQILKMLKDVFNNQNNDYKKLQKDARKYEKDMQQYLRKLDQSREKFLNNQKKKQQQQILNEFGRLSSQSTTDKKQKQNSLVRQIQKQTKQYQLVYRQTVKEYNDFVGLYNTQMNKIFHKLQQHQQQRLQKQIDAIMKMLVFQTSMMRNFDYDVSNISKQMDTIKRQSDIQSFIQINKAMRPKLVAQIPLTQNSSVLSLCINKVITKVFDTRLDLFQNNKVLKAFIDSKIKGQQPKQQIAFTPSQIQDFQKMHTLIESCWKVKTLKFHDINPIKQMTKNQRHRHVFSIMFKEFSTQLGPELPPAGYQNAVMLLQVLIQNCITQRDVFVLRKLLGLLFTIWTIDKPLLQNGKSEIIISKTKQKYLYMKLNNFAIWRFNDFWDSAVFQSVQQQLKFNLAIKGQTNQQAISRQKNILLKQLTQYCHFMIMLGNSSQTVRKVIGRFCRLYQLTQQQSKDISKTINNICKQYRQTFGTKLENSSITQ